MKELRWNIAGYDPAAAERMARESGMPPLLCAVLCARGLTDAAEARRYLSTASEGLSDPYALPDMEQAVACIRDAIEKKEKIAVYGDYDADGVTATCVLVRCLRELGADCVFYIPDRLGEGYGLHKTAIQSLYEAGVRLVVTVDTGVTAVEEAGYVRELGMRLVITDHHECQGTLPRAEAVVNPKRPGCGYPFPELAGVGVAFQLARALLGDTWRALDAYADLTAVGTVADVMPLTYENRILVNYGLRRLAETQNPGLQALSAAAGFTGPNARPLNAASISYGLSPRINAAGRFGIADRAAQLFLTPDGEEARAIVAELLEKNRARQGAEAAILQDALRQMDEAYDPDRDRAVVLWGEGWHHGVIGIVASRLADRCARPVVLLSVEDGQAKGSGRSVRGFNLFEALRENSGWLRRYGGHEQAAGLTLDAADLEGFRDAMRAYAALHLREEDCLPCLDIDCEVEPTFLTLDAVDKLSLLEPCGTGNLQPTFCMRELRLRSLRSIGQDKHTKLTLEKDGFIFDAVFFGRNSASLGLSEGERVDAAFHAQINDYRGRQVQLLLEDIRPSESLRREREKYSALYAAYSEGAVLDAQARQALRPVRGELEAVWRCIARRAGEGTLETRAEELCCQVRGDAADSLNPAKLRICLDVFAETGLIDLEQDESGLRLRLAPARGKVDLSASAILNGLS